MAHKVLVAERPIWTGALACYPYSKALAAKFSGLTRFGDPYTLFKVAGDKILLPRAACPVGQQDLRVVGLPQKFSCTFKPRDDEQARAVAEATELLEEGQSFIFEAPTGKGKTAMAMPLIAAVGRTTLIVVPKQDLVKRWREELQAMLGLKPSEIGTIQADTFDVAGKKVVVGMLQSLYKEARYPAWIKQEVGFVIFDEVHRLGAEQFVQVIAEYPALRRMGLSATPERRDGMEIAFQSHIGPVRVRITAQTVPLRVYRADTGWSCPRNYSGQKVPHTPGKDAWLKVLMSKNAARNKQIITAVTKSYAHGRSIVVFSDYVEHCEMLIAGFRSNGVKWDDASLYIGSMKEHERDKALAKRVIMATYGMMAEGTNVPWLDTCVLATPRANVAQPVGRILREYEDKKPAVLFDLLDDDSPVFKGYARSRLGWYHSIRAKVEAVKLCQ